MAIDAAGIARTDPYGVVAWGIGSVLFVATIGWSVRDNLTGRETGTGETKTDRRHVDRFANGFVPVALGYLLVGAGLSLAAALGTPSLSPVVVGAPLTHLFAAGTAGLLVFALGFRLLPRFLVVEPREWLVAVALPAAAAGSLVLVWGFNSGLHFRIGAALLALALGCFALAYADMFYRSDRRRVGLYTFFVAVVAGVVAGGFGLHMAVAGLTIEFIDVHVRVALLGFLGLAVVGISYQFYPPGVSSLSLVDDRTAATAVAFLSVGVGVECVGLLVGQVDVVTAGQGVALVGAGLHAFVVGAVFVERW